MAKKVHRIWEQKKFLNGSHYHSDATILSSVSLQDVDTRVYDTCTLKIRDCTQTISIALDMYTEANYKNSMKKLQIITENIEGLREGMVVAHKLRKEIKAKQNAAKQTGKKTKRVSSTREGI